MSSPDLYTWNPVFWDTLSITFGILITFCLGLWIGYILAKELKNKKERKTKNERR